jgi:fused signal recognition particle receptor
MGVFDIFKKKSDEVPGPVREKVQEGETTLDQSLEKTKTGFFGKLTKAIAGKTTVDESFLDDLEEALVAADVGVQTTVKIIDRLEAKVAREKYINTAELNKIMREEIIGLLADNGQPKIADFTLEGKETPYVIMVVGVNGVGKTTTIGKLAYQFKKAGKQVMLGAGDTFRAAAVDQLTIWSERVDVQIVSRGMGADPAAVAYDTVQSAVAKKMDVVIIDTAGRLHNKVGLMAELTKIRNVMQKVIPGAPHEVLLVLDASTGQNAIEQAKQFISATDVNAIALTKLDGTAKGGVVIGIADQFRIPVKYIGLGEKVEDLKPFDLAAFVNTLFK